MTGGVNEAERAVRWCQRYCIASDSWDLAPDMNVARLRHSACALGPVVYVFCGLDDSKRLANSNWRKQPDHDYPMMLKSIEYYDLRAPQSPWQFISTND
mmetsp:Transcript_23270/g.28852  ORF Transcript_23270/g.28852 Transcript_23270/m.28852 type:complete len:99 (-) Transcript_23270:360-656(-)